MDRKILLAAIMLFTTPAIALAQDDSRASLGRIALQDPMLTPPRPVGGDRMVWFGDNAASEPIPLYEAEDPYADLFQMSRQEMKAFILSLNRKNRSGGGEGILRSAVGSSTVPRTKSPPIGGLRIRY